MVAGVDGFEGQLDGRHGRRSLQIPGNGSAWVGLFFGIGVRKWDRGFVGVIVMYVFMIVEFVACVCRKVLVFDGEVLCFLGGILW